MQTQGGRASLTKSGSGTTQNAPNTRAPSGDLQQRQHTEGPRQSAGAVQASLSGQPVRPAPPAPNAPPPAVARAQPAVSQAPRGKQPQGTQSAGEAAIRKRAEERAKVPLKFRDSFKDFFFLPTGVLKILRLGLIIGALACFITAKTHELYIAITVLEICIVLFFIITYMLTLHHLLICLDWSLLDLINSFITAVFLLIVAILAMQEMERRHLFYAGGSLCLTAAIVCIFDGIMITKLGRDTVKRVLGLEVETNVFRPLEPTTQAPAREPAPATGKAPPPAPAKAPAAAPAKPPAPAPEPAPEPAPAAEPGSTSPPQAAPSPAPASRHPSRRASFRQPSQPPSRPPSQQLKGTSSREFSAPSLTKAAPLKGASSRT